MNSSDNLKNEKRGRGRGRPKTVNSNRRLDAVITSENHRMLEELAVKMGKSKSDIVRTSIELLYGMRKDSI